MLRWWDVLWICQIAPLMPGLLAGVVERFRRELEFWRWRRDYERLPEGAGFDLAYPTTDALGPIRPGNSSQLDLF